MKKILSTLLCLSMFLALSPVGTYAAVSDEPENKRLLESFGFPVDPNSYDKSTLKKGSYPMAPKYDLYLSVQNGNQKLIGGKTKTVSGSYTTINQAIGVTNGWSPATAEKNPLYFVTTGLSASGTGVEDYMAKVYFKDNGSTNEHGRYGGEILLSIYDANGNAVVTEYQTGGCVVTTDILEMWEVEGLLSVTSGDFDGDGVDEIAVYTPNNSAETADGSIHNSLFLGIFEFDAKAKKVSLKEYIDLTSKSSSDEICEWEYSYNGKNKQFYSLPYVALSANDLSGDGVDDLSAIVNFSTWFRGKSGTAKYTTKQILNHNTNFASVLESYEGTEGGNLKQVIKHKVLVTSALTGGAKDETVENRFILRNANLTVGDVTQEGSQEIIIAGNYTRANVENSTNDSVKVTSNRYVEIDGKALCHIVGYTSYNNLKEHNTYDRNADFSWTVQRTGNQKTKWYNEDDTDSAPITTSLCAFSLSGTSKPDTIFVGGQLFDYNNENSALEFTEDYTPKFSLDDTSVVWLGGAVAGNFTKDVFGREMLVFPYYYKVSGKNKFSCQYATLSESTTNSEEGGASSKLSNKVLAFEKSGTQQLVSAALLDGGGKTSYITYDGEKADVYYTDVEALAIMQAPPLYEELEDDDYIGNSATSYAKTEGTGSETSNGGSFTAGPVVGFEYEASFLGFIPCGGVDYEYSITASVTREKSHSKTFTYSTGFETSGTTDAVTVFTVPYVRYYCTMYMPEYKMPSQTNYNTMVALRNELEKNIENYVKTGEEQISGSYIKGCDYYEYKYSSYVDDANYQEQLEVLENVSAEIELIEQAIKDFNKGGTGTWGETVKGSIMPYTYSVPQAPLLTTVDVATYDAIAECTPSLDKIYGNVFPEYYRAGDPNTYAHKIGDLNTNGDKVLQSKVKLGDSSDGFLTNSSASAPGTSQSQVIAVDEEDSSSIGWGVGADTTMVGKGSVVKAGFTLSIEHNTSYITTNTKGQEYSGTVVAFPAGTPDDYSYDWKLVAYNAKLNGTKVPVVGYLTRVNALAPPSVAQNISIEDVKDKSVTLTWEDGDRKPHYYKVSRVAYDVGGETVYFPFNDEIKSVNGKCEFKINNIQPSNTSYYVIESYYDSGKKSVATQTISVTTLPEGFAVLAMIDGVEENVIYRDGKNLTANLKIEGNEKYDTLYQWQVDNGDGWKNIKNQNGKSYNFEISPLDNQTRIRCRANIFVGDRSYPVYSNPITLNCANEVEGYKVDWNSNMNALTITVDEDAKPADFYVKAVNENGTSFMKKSSSDDNLTFDLTDVVSENGTIGLYIWDENQTPLTYRFER